MGDSDQKVKRIKVKRSLAEKSNGFAIDIGKSIEVAIVPVTYTSVTCFGSTVTWGRSC